MILGAIISLISLCEMYYNGASLPLFGCFLLGVYIMTHRHNE